MESQRVDERSLSQVRLINNCRPFYIYFNNSNRRSEDILLSSSGDLMFFYGERDLLLPIHSDDCPALFYEDGSVAWVVNGRYHRSDGPAIVDRQHNTAQYWLHGSYYSEDDYFTKISEQGSCASEKSDGSNLLLAAVALFAIGVKYSISANKRTHNQLVTNRKSNYVARKQ